MSLWYFAKIMGYLLFKRQIERKTCRIYASFPKFSKPIHNPCQILDESIKSNQIVIVALCRSAMDIKLLVVKSLFSFDEIDLLVKIELCLVI